MQPVIAITTLLLWSSCYLNCSTGLFNELAEFFGESAPNQSCNSCPLDDTAPGDGDESNCLENGLVLSNCDSKAFSPQPGQDFEAAEDLLTLLLTSLTANRPTEVIPLAQEALSLPAGQLHVHVARPIRGPAA